MQKLDMSATWNDAVALFGSHRSMVYPLVGAFFFFPRLLMGHFGPAILENMANSQIDIQELPTYFYGTFPYIFLFGLTGLLGTLAILFLWLRPVGASVGEAIIGALGLFLTALLSVILIFIPVTLGFMLFIVPGIYIGLFVTALLPAILIFILVILGFMLFIVPNIYIWARFSPIMALIVAEKTDGPLIAIRRCWEVTNKNGWRIAIFLLLIVIAATIVEVIVSGVAAFIAGIVDLEFIEHFTSALIGSIVQLLQLAVVTAIYRQLARPDTAKIFS